MAKKRRGATKIPLPRAKSTQIFTITAMMTSCAGSRISYGRSPEYHSCIGGRNSAPKNATSAWPATRSANRASKTQRSGARPRDASGAAISAREHFPVVSVPVALEDFRGIVLALELEELGELRVAGLDLLARRVLVVGRVVAAAVVDADVDQPPERAGGAADPPGRV